LNATATDFAGNTANITGTFTVTVTLDSLGNLVQQFVTQRGIVTSLLAKLSAAAVSAGNGGNANQINSFINEVGAQSGKAIPADRAAILIALAQAL
jgi:hypothetical protein